MTASSLKQVSRAALGVVYAVAVLGRQTVTYYDVQRVLGLRSISGTKNNVRAARACGLVTVVETGGRSGQALIYLTDAAKELLRDLRRRRESHEAA